MKNKLIVLEGPDKIGKSTVINSLSRILNAKVLIQPNGGNSLGFLRQRLKSRDMDISPLARQLLHTCSHIVDYYEVISECNQLILMDRCYISALVYGQAEGENSSNLDLLKEVHNGVYGNLSDDFEIDIFVLSSSKLSVVGDESYYEKKLDMNIINKLYRNISSNENSYYLGSKERIHHIDIDEFDNADEVQCYIYDKLQSYSLR
ncbi:dTMP kinase [Vibrio splendidus]